MMERVLSFSFAAVLSVALVGCATMGGKSDEELIAETMETFKAGLLEQDVDKVMMVISENFENDQAPDKAAVGDFFGQAIDAGYLEGAEIDLTNAEVTIDGEMATAYPIDLSSLIGSVSVELMMTKEEGQWLVTGLVIDGL